MMERQKDPARRSHTGFLPWRQGVDEPGRDTDQNPCFQARYKRRYMLIFILFIPGAVWMGTSIFDSDMSEMFFAAAPLLIVPFIIRFFGIILTSMLAVLIPLLLYFASSDLADLLGKIVVILIFFIFLPLMGLLWLSQLIDSRPQLLVGPEGICCRQHGEDVIPWEAITSVYVTTYDQTPFLKIKTLVISLRDFSCYPKPSRVWTPQYLIYRLSQRSKKPQDPVSMSIPGVVLDPPLPFVMKAIEHYRPRPKSKRAQPQGSTPSEVTRS